jgi:uncharacterized protein YgiM (DUF1202 family)
MRRVFWSVGLSLLGWWGGALGEEPAFPYVGSVTGQRVNVRSGTSTNHRIVGVLNKGDEVTVLGKSTDWLKIQAPPSCKVWVEKGMGDFTDGGRVFLVRKERVNLRTLGSLQGDVVGQVNSGDRLQTVRTADPWVEVVAPDGAFVWISAKYVQYEKNTAEARYLKALTEAYASERSKPFPEQDLEGLRRRAQDIRAGIKSPDVRDQIDRMIAQINQVIEVQREFRQAIAQKEVKIDEIEARHRKKLAEILKAQEPSKREERFLKVGWIKGHGRTLVSSGTHYLVKGGETLAHLTGSQVKLDDYYNEYVGVNGRLYNDPHTGEPVIEVTEVERLVPEGS